MNNRIAADAAAWALSKVGCPYSQEKRNQDGVFDCSSLVARAYAAQGKRWRYGGSVPRSNQEVYDDDFELLWPEKYSEIGKKFGGADVLERACQPGDLQFLCTDPGTSRLNRITHVAMVADATTPVSSCGQANHWLFCFDGGNSRCRYCITQNHYVCCNAISAALFA